MKIQVGQKVKIQYKDSSGAMCLWHGAKLVTKEAVVKKIIDSNYATYVHLEIDGFLPMVVTRIQLREMMTAASPDLFRKEIQETVI